MSERSDECTHEKFEAVAAVFKSPDGAHTGVRFRVRCKTCGHKFRFDPLRVQVEGYDLTAAILEDEVES